MEIELDFQTPCNVADYMASLVETGNKILEPTPGKGNLINALKNKGCIVYYPGNDFWDMEHEIIYDSVVMNPPFSPMTTAYKFLYRSMELSNHIVALMPWLTIINGERRTNDIMNYGLCSITHLPRNIFKGSRIQCCILDMKKGFQGNVLFKMYQD
jgi:hypothetical protein